MVLIMMTKATVIKPMIMILRGTIMIASTAITDVADDNDNEDDC